MASLLRLSLLKIWLRLIYFENSTPSFESLEFSPSQIKLKSIATLTPPTKKDKALVVVLALWVEEPKAPQAGPLTRPQKHLHSDLDPEEVEEIMASVTKITTQLAGPTSATAKTETSKKKRRLRKVCSRGRTPLAQETAEGGVYAASIQETPRAKSADVIVVDDKSPTKAKRAEIIVAELEGV
ncbi:uncharacterized protein A4U43_UnF5090 [Asparagus officinalis]|uniref:Uncharacterized protein n=1 Tax=Asparagus officinalis TaxID=4686 RepID=A0A1R3L6S6_ASPOF|nr:uncharacterized protein A4U43_UnF5090 [Asparagus officinalis]